MRKKTWNGKEKDVPEKNSDTDRVLLNISGEIYETRLRTLERYPETLLGDFNKRRPYYNALSKEYFFDRSRVFFDAILFYYQSYGILKCPKAISLDLFEEECRFYQISEDAIFKLRVKDVDMSYLRKKPDDNIDSVPRTFRAKMWNILWYPESSIVAKCYVIFSMTVIFFSIVLACAETVYMHSSYHASHTNQVLSNSTQNSTYAEDDLWPTIELSFNSWFLLEVTATFIFSPCKKAFFTSFMNWIDMIAVIPYFLAYLLAKESVSSLGVLKVLRILRVTRLFRLSRHSTRIKVVGEVIKHSTPELKTLAMIIIITVVLQGGVMFYVEGFYEGTKFTSIPASCYWSVVTATTVGYGDISPETTLGKWVASAFLILGTLLLVTPVLNFADKFKLAYDSVTSPVWENDDPS